MKSRYIKFFIKIILKRANNSRQFLNYFHKNTTDEQKFNLTKTINETEDNCFFTFYLDKNTISYHIKDGIFYKKESLI